MRVVPSSVTTCHPAATLGGRRLRAALCVRQHLFCVVLSAGELGEHARCDLLLVVVKCGWVPLGILDLLGSLRMGWAQLGPRPCPHPSACPV
jgi:hypothetical protein